MRCEFWLASAAAADARSAWLPANRSLKLSSSCFSILRTNTCIKHAYIFGVPFRMSVATTHQRGDNLKKSSNPSQFRQALSMTANPGSRCSRAHLWAANLMACRHNGGHTLGLLQEVISQACSIRSPVELLQDLHMYNPVHCQTFQVCSLFICLERRRRAYLGSE